MYLKIFVVVIPKQGLAGRALPILLGMTPTIILHSSAFKDYTCILLSVSYPKKDWWGPARHSFFGYDNDKDIEAHFLVTWLTSVLTDLAV